VIKTSFTQTDTNRIAYILITKRKRTKNANETNEKRMNASHERHEKRTIHETNARYTKRMHDTRNQLTIHERTNHWSVHVAIYYPMTNDPGSIEVLI
jgi:hypothetical protein